MSDKQSTDTHPEAIPYPRFQKVVSDRDELKAMVDQLKQELQTASERAAAADTLAKQLEAVKAQAAQAETKLNRFQTATSYGLTDPDMIEFAELKASKLGTDFGEALESWKSDPAKAPTPLRSVFLPPPEPEPLKAQPEQAAPQQAASEPPKAKPAEPPRVQVQPPPTPGPAESKGAVTVAPGQPDYAPGSIMAMGLDAYRRNRAQILGQKSDG